MNSYRFIFIHFISFCFSLSAFAGDKIELDTAIIKGNEESPAILYIVPWKEMRTYDDQYQGLIIDDMQDNILTPVFPGNELLAR